MNFSIRRFRASRRCMLWCVPSLLAVALGVCRAEPPATEVPAPAPTTNDASAAETDASPARIASLVEQLGAADYFERERAQSELAALGYAAFDALTAAETHADLEIASRAGYLLRLLRVRWMAEDDPPSAAALLRDYEHLATAERQQVIAQLAQLPEDAGLKALLRLVRFERSLLLSKLAALALMEQVPATQPAAIDPEASTDDEPREEAARRAAWRTRGATVRAVLGESARPGAEWLRAMVAEAEADPATAEETAAECWSQLVTEEQVRLDQTPGESSADVVRRLLRREVELWQRREQGDRALAALRRLVEMEEGDGDSLADLLEWLVKQRAWDVLDDVAGRFEPRFQQNPLLCYLLAAARQAQGKSELVEGLVARARQLYATDQALRLRVGLALQRRGMLEWAEHEYRTAIQLGQPGDPTTLELQRGLAELLHDHERDAEAATVLQQAVTAMEGNARLGRQLQNAGRDPAAIRARLLYFQSCAARQKNDTARQIELLDEGIKHDPFDAEVLIALFHLPNATPERREQTHKQLRSAVDRYRQLIAQAPDNEFFYNQLAWLVANTEGDYQEALRCSQKSLELRPGEPGYLDTLARCYYALGDLDQAVRYQTQAARLEPYTRQIAKQLELFRAERARRGGKVEVPAAADGAAVPQK